MDKAKKEALEAMILELLGNEPDEVEKIELTIVWKPRQKSKDEKAKAEG